MIDLRLHQALENAEANIAYLATLPDKKLEKKLEIIHRQSVIAEEQKLTSSIQLLETWRSQIIEARIYKAQHQIPDSPNEIELAIADMETFTVTTEQRKELLNETKNQSEEIPEEENKDEKEESDNQLSLF